MSQQATVAWLGDWEPCSEPSGPGVSLNSADMLQVATLLVHAKYDPCRPSRRARGGWADPNAHLVGLQSGVHLKLGQTERVLREIAAFLSAPDKGD